MIPSDGTGYGRSIYWEMKAKQIARRQHEYCPCWDLRDPVISLSQDGKYELSVHCFISYKYCVKDFKKTDLILTKKFKQFYGKLEV